MSKISSKQNSIALAVKIIIGIIVVLVIIGLARYGYQFGVWLKNIF